MDRLHEPGGAVDVPHPGILEGELEEDLPAIGAYLNVDGVGQVEPSRQAAGASRSPPLVGIAAFIVLVIPCR